MNAVIIKPSDIELFTSGHGWFVIPYKQFHNLLRVSVNRGDLVRLLEFVALLKGKQASSMKRKRTGHFEKDDGYLWLLIINHFSFSLEYESFWNKDRPMKQLQPKGLDNHIENTLQIQEKINKTNKRDRITELLRHKYLICRWPESRMRKRQYCWTGYQTFLLSKKKKDKEFTGVEHVAADESLIMFNI